MKPEEVAAIKTKFNTPGSWTPIGASVPGLAGEFFLVTGCGKYFRNNIIDPEGCIAIIEIDGSGTFKCANDMRRNEVNNGSRFYEINK